MPNALEYKKLLDSVNRLLNKGSIVPTIKSLVKVAEPFPDLMVEIHTYNRTRDRQGFLHSVFGSGGLAQRYQSEYTALRSRTLVASLEGLTSPRTDGPWSILPARQRTEEPEYPFQGAVEWNGLTFDIENLSGTYRGDYFMKYPYGELRNSPTAPDGDKLDIYLGPSPEAEWVYVVHQVYPSGHKKEGQPDEDKVMVGWLDPTSARDAYVSQYDDPSFFGSMSMIPLYRFKKWVASAEAEGQFVQPPVKWKPRPGKKDVTPSPGSLSLTDKGTK